MTDSRRAIEAANLANTTQGLDYDEQERLLRQEMSAGAKLTREIINILGLIGLTTVALFIADKASAMGLSSFDSVKAGRNGNASLQLSADDLMDMGLVTGQGSAESMSVPGGFAEGLGVDRVLDSGVVTLADNPSDEAIAWVLLGGRQGAIDANVVWLQAHGRGGDDHTERTNLGIHLFGVKRFADGRLTVVASKMPHTGTDARYAPVPTGSKAEVVELPLVSNGKDWGILTSDGSFQSLFEGQFDGTFVLPLGYEKPARLEGSIFNQAISDPSGIVTVGPTEAPTPEISINTPELSPASADILKNLGPTFTMEQLNHPETIPFVDFDTLNSPEFAEAMVYAANHGMLPKHPDTATPMQYVTLSDDKFDGGGVNNYFAPDLPDSQAKEEARAYAPYITFNTSINGVPVNLTIEGYLNNDKSIGLLGIVTSPYPGSSDQSEFLKKSLTIGKYGRVIAGTYFKDHDSCLKYYGKTYKLGPVSADGLCKWAMSNQADQRFIRTFERWSNPQDGVLSNKTGSGSGTQYYLPIISMGYKTVAK